VTTKAVYRDNIINNLRVRYIEADLDCISVESITDKVRNSGKFGVNGPFFVMPSGPVIGIAVRKGADPSYPSEARPVRDYAASNDYHLATRGTIYHFDPAFNWQFLDTAVVNHYLDYKDSYGNNVPASNVKWAVSGYSLHPNLSLTKTDYYDKLKLEKVNPGPGTDYKTARTAIGYRTYNSRRLIVLAVFENATPWEVRETMKDYIGCNVYAVMLDGGGSSTIRWKTAGGSTGLWEAESGGRSVYAMVTANPDIWE
jgi:hypothetical protein